jgi:tetratricopeptide (TPR) repeat protein
MLAGEYEAAVRVGNEALAMAEELRLNEVRAHVLNNIGCARAAVGDFGGVRDLEQSIEIADAVSSPDLSRAYNNLSTVLASFGHVDRSLELRRRAVVAGERLGNLSTARFSAIALTLWDYPLGNWDECVAKAHAFLTESERLGGSYQDAYLRSILALIAAARGRDADALSATELALELARRAEDPQILRPVLAEVALVELELGSSEAARTHAAASLQGATYLSGGARPDASLALFAKDLAIERELRARVDAAPAEDRWAPPIGALLDGDYPAAADLYREMGLRTLEAHARLRAAERLRAETLHSEAGEQLDRALLFWRSVGATRYIREVEAMLEGAA